MFALTHHNAYHERLRGHPIINRGIPSIQIVVVSGKDALREALSAGASGYVMKTEVAERLATELRKVQALRSSEASELDVV